MDAIVNAITGPLIDRGVLGITTLLFLGLYLWSNWQRGKDREAYDEDRDKMLDRVNKLQEDRVSETRELARVVTEFSHTSQIVLELSKKGT